MSVYQEATNGLMDSFVETLTFIFLSIILPFYLFYIFTKWLIKKF